MPSHELCFAQAYYAYLTVVPGQQPWLSQELCLASSYAISESYALLRVMRREELRLRSSYASPGGMRRQGLRVARSFAS